MTDLISNLMAHGNGKIIRYKHGQKKYQNRKRSISNQSQEIINDQRLCSKDLHLLKKRNEAIKKQNELFNDYFFVFEKKYAKRKAEAEFYKIKNQELKIRIKHIEKIVKQKSRRSMSESSMDQRYSSTKNKEMLGTRASENINNQYGGFSPTSKKSAAKLTTKKKRMVSEYI